MPHIGRIDIHPIKALDPVRLSEAAVLASGALAFDRRWALFDDRERPINGKNRLAIHRIRASFDLARLEVTLTLDGRTFSLERERQGVERWFADRLDERVVLREDCRVGFPDDLDSPGPTFVTAASVARVAEWFAIDVAEARRRFRTNLEMASSLSGRIASTAAPFASATSSSRRSTRAGGVSCRHGIRSRERRYQGSRRASWNGAKPSAARPRRRTCSIITIALP
jgi:uncharacterized protein YcbX